jgi:N-acetylglucosamine malate deacetylase 1
VLAVFAHPDDAELACFGTLAGMAASGVAINILTLTDGRNSSAEESYLRPSEAKEAAGIIRADLVIEGFVDGDLSPSRALYSCVSTHLERVKPSIVITHYPHGQDHQDHLAVGQAVTAVSNRMDAVALVLQAEPPSGVGPFHPNFYVDVTEHMPEKLEALGKYISEIDKPFMKRDAVMARGQWWARQAEMHAPKPRLYEAFLVAKARIEPATMSAFF